MEEATHLAWAVVSVETLWRLNKCSSLSSLTFHEFQPGVLLFTSYILCIGVIYLDIKRYAFFQSTTIRNTIKFLHAADGVTALAMGMSVYHQSNLWMFISILAITKGFLLHLLSRMVTGVQTYHKSEVALQTTKTFLHHTGSFLFISHPKVAVVTAIWRFTSMNGHAILTLKGWLSERSFSQGMWMFTHARNAVMLGVLLLCAWDGEVRRGFGEYIIQ